MAQKKVAVAFLTDSSFDSLNERAGGSLKKRALRAVARKVRCFVYESSTNPDVVYEIRRLPGSKSWCLHRRVYSV